ncbi:hypothetical protein EEJ42_16365 [Streptomyces botrytidirepellens]|uniref:Uncharacterized protein n=1 Tax=Streptomyces botrytidirepellens TaxID=2486417 RepID=A0A3M8WDL7_9ACTN|nr:hypothetical protein EEJ42_16365 [Streptomyces botrytidirepellens]
MDVADQAFQYADEAANGAERAAARSSTRDEERLETAMHAAHAHWLVAERHYGRARDAHADGEKSRLEYHASEAVSAAVATQRAAGVATTADALREVLDELKPAAERARLAEWDARLKAELDRDLTAVTRMDAANRDRLLGARWRAESAVPELGWWPTLAADMAHAYQGRLWLDETGTPRLLKKTADGRVVAGRKVDAERVAMLRAAGFLVTGTNSETSTSLRPSDMGRESLYLATLYPEGLHADERAAYEARYEQSRRPWMNNEDRKTAARRLPPLDRYTMQAAGEKPVLLEDGQVPQISTEDAARHADMAELAQRLGRWAAMSHGENFDVIQAPGTGGAQEPAALAGELGQDDVGEDERAPAAPSSELPPPGQNAPLAGTTSSTTTPDEASEGTPPTADNPAALGLFNPVVETAAPPPHKPSGETAAPPPTTPLARDWALALADVGAPHSEEAAAAAWALRGVLADNVLIALMAALDDDDAFARWKSRHMRYYGEGTGRVNKDLAPGGSVSHKYSAKHFEARIGDHRVKMTWDRIRAWLREATTPEALSLLQAAEEAGARLRGGSHGDSLLAATGELALARDLRAQVKRLTTQVLDHVVQFMATTPVPTGRRGKPSARAAAGTSLFDQNEAPAFELPGADQVRADLDRLIAYLPDPRADREPETVPLSALRTGMVLDRDDTPVVITEITHHPGRCDIVGEFRGPIRPALIEHSVELTGQDSDPLIPLAPLLPSLHELTGRAASGDGSTAPEEDRSELPTPQTPGALDGDTGRETAAPPDGASEPGDEVPEMEGWSGDAPSALAEPPSAVSWDDDEVPSAPLERPGPQDDSATSAAPAEAETGETSEAPAVVPGPESTAAADVDAPESTKAEEEGQLDISPSEIPEPAARERIPGAGPERTHTPTTTPLAEAEEALTAAETIRSHLHRRSTTSALLQVREAWDTARSHYEAGRLTEGDAHLATARSHAILARAQENAHADFKPLKDAVRRFHDAADEILYPSGAGWRPAVGDIVRSRHLYVPDSDGFREKVVAIEDGGIRVQSASTGDNVTLLQPTDLGPHGDLTWEEQPFRAPGQPRASGRERRARLALAPEAATDAPAPASAKTSSTAQAQASAGQSDIMDPAATGTFEHPPRQGGDDGADTFAGEAAPERTQPWDQPRESPEPRASEDENEYGRGRYVPWGWPVAQGMARATDEAKAQPRPELLTRRRPNLGDPPIPQCSPKRCPARSRPVS